MALLPHESTLKHNGQSWTRGLEGGMLYGEWHHEGDVIATMDEICDYVARQEFWYDHCKGHLNRKYYDFEQLQTVMRAYEALLRASIFLLESHGWQFEPAEDALITQLDYL